MERPYRPERREHEVRATLAHLFLSLIDEEDRETALTAENPAYVFTDDCKIGRERQATFQAQIEFYGAELERVRAILDRGSNGGSVWWAPVPTEPALTKADGSAFVTADQFPTPPTPVDVSIAALAAEDVAALAEEKARIDAANEARLTPPAEDVSALPAEETAPVEAPAFGTYGTLLYH